MNFPKVGNAPEPKPGRKMSLEEYIEFCELCLKGNSRITPENCLQRGEGIRQPFLCKVKMIYRESL